MVEITQLGNEQAYNFTAAVGLASAVISRAKHRKSFVLRNISTGGEVITIAFSNFSAAVAGEGVVLNPNDAIADANSGSYVCWSGDFNAIATGAGGQLAVMEVI